VKSKNKTVVGRAGKCAQKKSKKYKKKQASDRLANVRKIVEERFAKYDHPDLPPEYQV
jgi:hypothetical protein